MSKVFISYRHIGDAWAADRIYDWISEKFPTFMDMSIRRGDPIPEDIERNLGKSRVFIAVIGKGWVSPRGLKRLAREDDWVRREILKAMSARPAMRVIPVLIDDDVSKLSAEHLPPELRPLADLAWERMSHERWNRDIENLLALIEKGLVEADGNRSVEADPAPVRNLAYLCDRTPQENDLTIFVKSAIAAANLFCVLAGHWLEAHVEFVSRLRSEHVFQDLLAAKFDEQDGVELHLLPWDPTRARGGQYADLLRFALRSCVMGKRLASDDELTEFLRTAPRPVVCVFQVTWSDIMECGSSSQVLLGLLRAWNELISQLSSNPRSMLVLWINVTFDETGQDIAQERGIARLTNLEAVNTSDIGRWLLKEEVKRFISGREELLWKGVRQKNYCIGLGKLHMQRFADVVRRLDHKG
jgi:hypothetical protein